MTTFLRKRRIIRKGERGGYHQEDVKHACARKEKVGGYHQEDVKHACAGKEKKGRPR